MKIAYLSFYSGHTFRGVETHVHEVANRLSGENTVTVFQIGPKLAGSKYETKTVSLDIDWDAKDIRRTSAKFSAIDYWSLSIKKFTELAFKDLDPNTDILIPTNGLWQSFLSRIWSTTHSSKMVIAGHSGPGIDDRINLWCRPDIFVALTDFQLDWAKRAGFGVKVEKIPNGVDLGIFNPKIKPAKVNLQPPIVLCVAALEPNKRIDLVIKAVSQLKGASLLVVGKGALYDELNALGKELLPGRFLISHFTHDQMPGIFAASKIFSMVPVSSESFGIVFLEAMASGLAVVATDDPIRREIIGKAGLFVDPTKEKEFSDAISQAIETNWRNAPYLQSEKFSWDQVASQYQTLFENILKK